MCAAWRSGTADVCQQCGVVASDLEVEGDDLHSAEHSLDQSAARTSPLIVGKLDTDQEFRSGNRADGDVSIVATQKI